MSWLKFASPFYYYAGHDPLGNGIDLSDLAVLGAATVVLMVIATLGFRYRDLRAESSRLRATTAPRASASWRDPDSNRGHHDFQAPPGTTSFA